MEKKKKKLGKRKKAKGKALINHVKFHVGFSHVVADSIANDVENLTRSYQSSMLI
jgi:hypothetical protein